MQLAIADEGAVKLGYYIQVAGSVDANNNLQNPGVYLNHRMVALQGDTCVSVSLDEVAGVTRLVPLDHPLLTAARGIGISLGVAA